MSLRAIAASLDAPGASSQVTHRHLAAAHHGGLTRLGRRRPIDVLQTGGRGRWLLVSIPPYHRCLTSASAIGRPLAARTCQRPQSAAVDYCPWRRANSTVIVSTSRRTVTQRCHFTRSRACVFSYRAHANVFTITLVGAFGRPLLGHCRLEQLGGRLHPEDHARGFVGRSQQKGWRRPHDGLLQSVGDCQGARCSGGNSRLTQELGGGGAADLGQRACHWQESPAAASPWWARTGSRRYTRVQGRSWRSPSRSPFAAARRKWEEGGLGALQCGIASLNLQGRAVTFSSRLAKLEGPPRRSTVWLLRRGPVQSWTRTRWSGPCSSRYRAAVSALMCSDRWRRWGGPV